MRQNRRGGAQVHRGEHLGRTSITLGAILLVGVAVSLASEVYLQVIRTTPDAFESVRLSFRATISIALVALQGVLPVVGALVAAPVLVARLLHDIHGTNTVSEAHDRLNQLLFGALGARRRVVVREGKLASNNDRVVERVGGPAVLTVYGDSAVVTEQGGSLRRVLTAGTHRLDRFERIWETVDLRPQRWLREVFALTKEGIPINCDVDIVFRIDGSREPNSRRQWAERPPRDRENVFHQEAVLRAATSRWICDKHELSQSENWQDRVAGLVESALRDILATYRLDWLIRAPQPDQQHPRDEIHQRLRAKLEHQVREIGAELLDIDLGQIRVAAQGPEGDDDEDISETLSDIISGQWIDAWQATWRARALASRAEGEAELLRMETARIEAQAEMIIGLAEILQPTAASPHASEPYGLALRLVEALRWMSYDPQTRDYMPPEAMRTLRRLQQLLDSEGTFAEGGISKGLGGEYA